MRDCGSQGSAELRQRSGLRRALVLAAEEVLNTASGCVNMTLKPRPLFSVTK